jgi:DNA polymerase (family 10)
MIDRVKIAAVLEEIALLKRIAGEVEFKAAAFDRAARAIERMEDLERRLREQSLADAEGLGMSTARAVHEIVKTGTCSALTELRASIVPGLLQWINIPGLGPKKIRKIHTDLAISTVDELAAACADGRVAGLAGFGEKSAAKILKSVEWIRSNSARCRIDEAEDAAQPFLAALKRVPGLERLEIAGSYRRGLETIGDIDLLAAAEPAAAPALLEAFTTHPDVTEVLGRGDTKASVRSTSGRQIDLRVVAPAAYGSALLYFTGSKEHNVALRGRAREKGLALNEYGIFHLDPAGETDSTRPIPSPTEEAIYEQLGLPWIPPERREGRDEIADYATGRAGELVAQGHIRGVMHLHTTWSDGTAGIEEMARACMERGYEWTWSSPTTPAPPPTPAASPSRSCSTRNARSPPSTSVSKAASASCTASNPTSCPTARSTTPTRCSTTSTGSSAASTPASRCRRTRCLSASPAPPPTRSAA